MNIEIQNDEIHVKENKKTMDTFVILVIVLELSVILLYGVFSEYNYTNNQNDIQRYSKFTDINVMMIVGFGFLMSFLKKFGYSSLTMTFFLTTLIVQIHPLFFEMFKGIFTGVFEKVSISITTLILGNFAVATVLISFGAVIGKISITQTIVFAIFETFVYSLNEHISKKLGATDIGGSIFIHVFGTFFGITCSRILNDNRVKGNSDNSAIYHSDMFAMIGTMFLWIYWPSFNGALVDNPDTFSIIVVNTYLSLSGSCVSAILFSYILRGEKKISMVDVQNASLAGGVAIGSCVNLSINPGSALTIGLFAGSISTFGYTKLQSKLETLFGIYDTCGILNLHGLPGLFGGIFSILVLLVNHRYDDAGIQLLYLIITLVISIISGLITGLILKSMSSPEIIFQDINYFEVPTPNTTNN